MKNQSEEAILACAKDIAELTLELMSSLVDWKVASISSGNETNDIVYVKGFGPMPIDSLRAIAISALIETNRRTR